MCPDLFICTRVVADELYAHRRVQQTSSRRLLRRSRICVLLVLTLFDLPGEDLRLPLACRRHLCSVLDRFSYGVARAWSRFALMVYPVPSPLGDTYKRFETAYGTVRRVQDKLIFDHHVLNAVSIHWQSTKRTVKKTRIEKEDKHAD